MKLLLLLILNIFILNDTYAAGECSHFMADTLKTGDSFTNSFFGTVKAINIVQEFDNNVNSFYHPQLLLKTKYNLYGYTIVEKHALSPFGECIFSPYPYRYCSRFAKTPPAPSGSNINNVPKMCLSIDPMDSLDLVIDKQPMSIVYNKTNLITDIEQVTGTGLDNDSVPQLIGIEFASPEYKSLYKYLIDSQYYNNSDIINKCVSNTNIGCQTLSSSPKPQPYKDDKFITSPYVLVEKICAPGENPSFENYCVKSRNNVQSTPLKPGISVTLVNHTNFLPACGILNNTTCASIINTGSIYHSLIPDCSASPYSTCAKIYSNSLLVRPLNTSSYKLVYQGSIRDLNGGPLELLDKFEYKPIGVILNLSFINSALNSADNTFFESQVQYTKNSAGFIFDESNSNHNFNLSIKTDGGTNVSKSFTIQGYTNKFCIFEKTNTGQMILHKCIPKGHLKMSNIKLEACNTNICSDNIKHESPSVKLTACDIASGAPNFNDTNTCQSTSLSIGQNDKGLQYIYDRPVVLFPVDDNLTMPDGEGKTCSGQDCQGKLNVQNYKYISGAKKVCIYGITSDQYTISLASKGSAQNSNAVGIPIVYYPGISYDDHLVIYRSGIFGIEELMDLRKSDTRCFSSGTFDFKKCAISPASPLQVDRVNLCVDVPPPSNN